MHAYPLDLAELNLPKTCETKFPDKDDLLHFKLVITPDEVLEKCITDSDTQTMPRHYCTDVVYCKTKLNGCH